MTVNPNLDDMTEDEILAAGLSAAQRMRAQITAIEKARDEQPQRLAEMRAAAEQARTETLAAEPWVDTINVIPTTDAETGELDGMAGIPSVDAKELWGARLAFDMANTGGDSAKVDEVLNRYFTALHGNTQYLFIVFSAALTTLAEYVLPQLLDSVERTCSNYDTRVLLADAARNAWATRIKELRR